MGRKGIVIFCLVVASACGFVRSSSFTPFFLGLVIIKLYPFAQSGAKGGIFRLLAAKTTLVSFFLSTGKRLD